MREDELMSRLEHVYASGVGDGALEHAAAALAAGLGTLGADAGFVATPSPDGRTLHVARVTPSSTASVRLAFSADAPYPLAAAVRRDEALFISSNEALTCDHPGLVRVRGEDHACATVPLHGAGGEVVGSANVSFAEPREFTADDRARLLALFRECEQSLTERA